MAQIIKYEASNLSIVWHDDLTEILEAEQSPETEAFTPFSLLDDSELVAAEVEKIRREGMFGFFDNKAGAHHIWADPKRSQSSILSVLTQIALRKGAAGNDDSYSEDSCIEASIAACYLLNSINGSNKRPFSQTKRELYGRYPALDHLIDDEE